jgi:tripartite-type tricarboxylate transporter receptor subunit TctC
MTDSLRARTATRRRQVLQAVGALGASLALPVFAQGAWPARPVRLVVNFAPGSSPDLLARAISGPLQQALGQSVTVENRSGAGGMVGGEAVVKSPADGYTLLVASGSSVSINPLIYPRMPYDPARDLAPVAALARIEVFLAARSEASYKTYAEFVRFAKANPGRLTYGSPGNGTSPHLAGEMLKSKAGFFAVHVPYRGSAPALQALLAGQLDYMFDPGIAFEHVRSGRLRMLAVGSARRVPLWPDMPTLDELGLKGFDAGTTHAVYAPASTPADVVTRLNAEINKALAVPHVRTMITNLGAEATPMSPADLRNLQAADLRRFTAIVQERKISADT